MRPATRRTGTQGKPQPWPVLSLAAERDRAVCAGCILGFLRVYRHCFNISKRTASISTLSRHAVYQSIFQRF